MPVGAESEYLQRIEQEIFFFAYHLKATSFSEIEAMPVPTFRTRLQLLQDQLKREQRAARPRSSTPMGVPPSRVSRPRVRR